jgi:hypothetical protein|tara:strand:- start:23 stop:235 length:213 start_codon:yes stop_codon:yes gene_type:complete
MRRERRLIKIKIKVMYRFEKENELLFVQHLLERVIPKRTINQKQTGKVKLNKVDKELNEFLESAGLLIKK